MVGASFLIFLCDRVVPLFSVWRRHFISDVLIFSPVLIGGTARGSADTHRGVLGVETRISLAAQVPFALRFEELARGSCIRLWCGDQPLDGLL